MDDEAWIARPNVCRCCLAASGAWNLTTTPKNSNGIEEVLADTLKTCFGITLSYLTDAEISHAMCGDCVNLLQTSYNFRQQILATEEKFVRFYSRLKGQAIDVKQETSSDYTRNYLNEEKLDAHSRTWSEHMLFSNIKLGNNLHDNLSKTECENSKISDVNFNSTDEYYDSDAPISELFHDKKLENIGDVIKCIENPEELVKNEFVNISAQHPAETRPKTISERKRVMLTCAVVLKNTTACPFRHHKSWFQCFYCPAEFMDMTTLRNHSKEKHQDIESELRKMKRYPRSLQIDISNLECRECQLSLTDVDSMRRHFETTHNALIYNEFIADYKVDCSPYSCHLCKEEFHVFRTLTTHLNEHYANCICDVCGRSFINSKRLKVHKRTHENGHFPCTECGKILKTKTSKSNHMESAHSKRQLKCQICFKPMKHYNDRIKHMSEIHNITHIFKCKICSKEYNVKHYLATHMRQTHGNKNKKCPDCGMVFITNHGLKKHMGKHTGLKPHKCIVCGKAYARSYTLKEHMRCHESVGT
ncbi:zinc-finger associated domain (zf-AD) domain-containing protein [Phthorimaea operculella]|nr:zinc-finger associated domain (zf-AD) domain-containing protein [Phthorimaea operculella]